MASRFTKFNHSRTFNVNTELFREGANLTAQTLYEEDGESSQAHLVVGIWKHNFRPETLIQYPELPPYNYTIGVKMNEGDYAYVSVPLTMNETFDEIMGDPSLIKEINLGRCAICAYHFDKKGEDRYGLEFC